MVKDPNRKCFCQARQGSHNVKVKPERNVLHCDKNIIKYDVVCIFKASQHVVLLAVFVCHSAAFVTMFRAAVKKLSAATTSSTYRGILFSIRHYCKRTPRKLRISEAVSGAELGANITVQVTLTLRLISRHLLEIFFRNNVMLTSLDT